MIIMNKLLLLMLPFIPASTAQLPFFLQRFRPVRHGFLSSGSSSIPSFASSLLSLSSAPSLLSPTYASAANSLSLLSGSSPFSNHQSGLGSLGLSYPFASASMLSPQFGFPSGSGGSLFGASSFAPLNFGGSSGFASSHHFGHPSVAANHHLLGSQAFAASQLGSPSVSASHLLGSQAFAASQLSPNFKFLPSASLSQSLVDLGTVGSSYDGLGSFDQADLLDDYPGFSNAGFGKDLNFAGSQNMKSQSSSPYSSDNEVVFMQKSNDKK